MFRFLSLSDRIAILILLVLIAGACLLPRLGDGIFRRIERAGAALARRKRLAIILLLLLVPALRLSLLHFLPVPVPRVHDEFSYLLAADTFAHGRLTNPTHPMWRYMESIHVNQLPTYMSKYPPAQGAVLALGQLLGNSWIGVVLSTSLMCGAVLWMMQGWLPPRWALLGGILVAVRFAIAGYWINSYWGGSVTALAGALVAGAVPRIIRRHRWQDALILGLGAGILALVRPLEGLFFCLPVAAYLARCLAGKKSPPLRVTAPRLIVPVTVLLAATVIFAGYYNFRLTGSVLTLPYQLNDRTYSSTPPFVWQKIGTPIPQKNPILESFYNGWSRSYWNRTHLAPEWHVAKFVYFYLWPEWCFVLPFFYFLLVDRRVRFLLLQFCFSFLGTLLVVWFEPHYAAALLAPLFVLVVQGIRHLRQFRPNGKFVGVAVARVLVLFAIAAMPARVFSEIKKVHGQFRASPSAVWDVPGDSVQTRVEAELNSLPGQHLVIVGNAVGGRGPAIFNKADIDDAKIVWAYEIPDLPMQPLLTYFQGRTVWLLQTTSAGPKLTAYPQSTGAR